MDTQPLTAQIFSSSTTPIHRVPPEILANILHFLPHDAVGLLGFPDAEFNWGTEPQEPVSAESWSSIRWVKLLGVCRYWRATMLTSPFLWNTVIIDKFTSNSSDALVHFFVDRAGTLPLRVYGANPASLAAVADVSYRLQDLRVVFTNSFVVTRVMSVFTKPAPLLETLSVCYQHPIHDIVGPSTYTSIHLPILFDKQTPRLLYLHLERIFSWGNNLFDNLTHIIIQGCEIDSISPQQFFMLVRLLRASPDLRELNLMAPHPWIPDVSDLDAFEVEDFDSDITSLPQLERLSLAYAAPPQASFFLQRLEVPRQCSVSISEVAYPDHGIFASLPQDHSRIGTFQEITSLSIMQHGLNASHALATGPSGSLRISADLEREHWPISDPELDAVNSADGTYLGLRYHIESIAQARWHFPTTYLTELFITGPSFDSVVSAQDWVITLSALPSLETLLIRKRQTNDILPALTAQTPAMSIVCPYLQTLYLCTPPTLTMPWTVMSECLTRRKGLGHSFRLILCRWSGECLREARPEGFVYRAECTCPDIRVPVSASGARHAFWQAWPGVSPS